MRKYLTLAVIALLVAAITPAPALAGQEKVAVCHLEGTGEFHLISIADPAFEAHVAHGDGIPGGEVPGMPGYVFDETCQAIEALDVSVSVDWINTIGTILADSNGLTWEFGGQTFYVPVFYHPQYWGTYGLYLPGAEALPVVDIDILGVPEATLTLTFEVYQINQDGTVGTSSTPYPGASFQHSFVAVEGVTTQVVPAGVAPDVDPPYGFPVIDPGDAQLLHLATATVYLGTDTTTEPLVTVESIVDLG